MFACYVESLWPCGQITSDRHLRATQNRIILPNIMTCLPQLSPISLGECRKKSWLNLQLLPYVPFHLKNAPSGMSSFHNCDVIRAIRAFNIQTIWYPSKQTINYSNIRNLIIVITIRITDHQIIIIQITDSWTIILFRYLFIRLLRYLCSIQLFQYLLAVLIEL